MKTNQIDEWMDRLDCIRGGGTPMGPYTYYVPEEVRQLLREIHKEQAMLRDALDRACQQLGDRSVANASNR